MYKRIKFREQLPEFSELFFIDQTVIIIRYGLTADHLHHIFDDPLLIQADLLL